MKVRKREYPKNVFDRLHLEMNHDSEETMEHILINHVSVNHREIFYLHFKYGYKLRKIAEAYHVSIEAIKNIIASTVNNINFYLTNDEEKSHKLLSMNNIVDVFTGNLMNEPHNFEWFNDRDRKLFQELGIESVKDLVQYSLDDEDIKGINDKKIMKAISYTLLKVYCDIADTNIDNIHKPDSGWLEGEKASISIIEDYNYMLPY